MYGHLIYLVSHFTSIPEHSILTKVILWNLSGHVTPSLEPSSGVPSHLEWNVYSVTLHDLFPCYLSVLLSITLPLVPSTSAILPSWLFLEPSRYTTASGALHLWFPLPTKPPSYLFGSLPHLLQVLTEIPPSPWSLTYATPYKNCTLLPITLFSLLHFFSIICVTIWHPYIYVYCLFFSTRMKVEIFISFVHFCILST